MRCMLTIAFLRPLGYEHELIDVKVSGTNCGDWKQAYANYLVKYIQLYAEAGVKVTHLGFLNEPDMR